jgi:predicted RNA-binding Zn ribbon-like protein
VRTAVTCQGGDVRFEFTSGRPALDFLATLAARGTVDEEKLTTPADLADWITEWGVVDSAPHIGPDDLTRARALREALFRVIAALIDERTAGRADRLLVNATAAGPLPVLQLEPGGLRREGDIDAVLAVLARDALDLHAADDRTMVHRCADPGCSRIFVDRSRGGRRRWCGMKGCGDRAKAAAYRRRRATPP